MADIESNIRIDVDTSSALESLKNLQRQISAFQKQMQSSSAANASAARDLQRSLIGDINATGKFAAKMETIKSSTESFTQSLEKNKLSMGEYFKYSLSQTKSFGKSFATEFATIEKVARERVKTLQTQYISLGRDATGSLNAISVRPLELDLKNLATQQAINAQKQQIFNQLLKQGSTNLLNFGKNTQWAGRQLMVGFTIPLSIFGSTAAKAFMELEEQVIKFKRVYGDLMTPSAEADEMIDQIKELGLEYTKYGVAVKDTMNLAADAAAMGKKGADLTAQVTAATRLSVLGNVSQQEALETSVSITNAFGVATEQLAGKIDFLNAVENQTVTSIQDLTEAIPKAGPVVQQLGGDVEDLAFFLTAMKEGGINASEGANALKSGLASLINPTGRAADMLRAYGINIKQIVSSNAGNVSGIVVDFAKALDQLNPTDRAKAIEQLFGKFQFSRISTLFQNVIAEGSQASKVLELMGATSTELAALSSKELKTVEESVTYKFKAAIEEFKAQLAPVGEEFMKLVTPLIQFGSKVLETFNNMGDHAKGFITGTIAVLGGLAPVALMTFGLVANGVANLVKGFQFLRNIFLGVSNSETVLGEQTSYLTQEQLKASAVAASLEQVHSRLPQIFTAEAGAVDMLTAAYQRADAASGRFASRPIPTSIGKGKTQKFSTGGFVSGSGNGDVIPAMLTPGEFVVKKDVAQKVMPFLQALNSGNIPGFNEGGKVSKARAHVSMPFAQGSSEWSSGVVAAGLEKLAGEFPQFVKVVSNLVAELPQKVNIALIKGIDSSAFGKAWSASSNKMLSSAKLGGLDISQQDNVDAVNRLEKEIGQAAMQMAESTADKKVTDDILAKATREVVDANVMAEGAVGRAARAFDQAAKQVGQVRVQVPTADIREGLSSGKFAKNDLGHVSYDGTQIARESQSKPGKFRPASSYSTAKSYARQELMSLEKGFEDGLKDAAKTASPSKRTKKVADDTVEGYVIGLEEGKSDVTQAGRKRGRGASSGGPVSVGNGSLSYTKDPKSGNVVASEKFLAMEQTRAAARQRLLSAEVARTTGRLKTFSNAAMAISGAVGTVAMTASAFGIELGGFGDAVFQATNTIFLLTAATKGLIAAQTTQRMMTGALDAASLIGGGKGTGLKGLGNFLKGLPKGDGSAVKNIFSNLGNVAKGAVSGLGKFGPTILKVGGLLVKGIPIVGALFTAFQIGSAIYNETKNKIEGLGDTAFLSAEKMKKAGDLLGFEVKDVNFKGSFAGNGTEASSSKQQTDIDTLRANEDFKSDDGFGKQINAIKGATKAQAELTLKSLSVQLAASGAPQAAVDTLVKALAQEAGKTDLDLSFTTQIDFSTKEGMSKIASIGQDVATAFTTEFEKSYNSSWSSFMGQSVAMTSAADNAASEYASLFTGLKSGLESGTLDAAEFNTQIAALQSQLSSLDPSGLAMIMPTIIKTLDIETQMDGITRVEDQIVLISAAAAGITFPTKDLEKFRKASKADATEEDLRVANELQEEYKTKIQETTVAKQESNAASAQAAMLNEEYATAIVGLEDQRDNLLDQKFTYDGLIASGYSAAQAIEAVGNANFVAAYSAATNAAEQKKVLEIWEQIKGLEKSSPIKSGGGGGAAEKSPLQKATEQLADQIKQIRESSIAYGKLTRAGMKASDAFAMAKDPILAAAVASTKVGTSAWTKLIKLIKQANAAAKTSELLTLIKEMKMDNSLTNSFANVAPLLSKIGLTGEQIREILSNPNLAQKFVDDLKDGAINSKIVFDYLTALKGGVNAEIKFNGKTPEGLEDEFSKMYDRAMEGFDVEERTIESAYAPQIAAAEKAVSSAQKAVDAAQKEIDGLQTTVDKKQREIEMTIDRPIEELNGQIEKLQREMEVKYDRPLADLQEESGKLSNDLAIIDHQAEQINKRYDEQQKALEQVSQVNQDIRDQDKSRLSIADALSKGNAADAVRAMQAAQQEQAAKAKERAQAALDVARQNEINGLRSAAGLTREQIAERQYQIGQASFALEQKKAEVQDKIVKLEDSIYSIEQKRQPLLAEIRNIEDQMYNIQVTKLEPAQKDLDAKQDALDLINEQKDAELEAVGLKKKAWEDAQLAVDTARVKSQGYITDLKTALGVVEDIQKAWAAVGSKTVADVTGKITDDTKITPTKTVVTKTGTDSGTKKEPAWVTTARSDIKKYQGLATAAKTAISTLESKIRSLKNAGATAQWSLPSYQQQLSGKRYELGQLGQSIAMLQGKIAKAGYANGGIVKGYAAGGFAMGTDTVPAMLTPGEFVVKRSSVQSFGTDRLKAINSGTYDGESVYNYSVNVNVQSGADANKIAQEVMTQIKRIDSQRIRGNRQ